MSKKQSKGTAYKLLRPIFTGIFRCLYHPKIIHKEYIPKQGSGVIAGNHKHAFDPVCVDSCTKRIVHTLAKKDLHDSAFGWVFRMMETIPVDLHADKNKAALDKAVEYLQDGALINVSPEGKRNYTTEILLPFKYGAVVMAQRSGCMITPYAITGDYKLMNKNLKITFGEPLDVSELSVEAANELLFQTIKSLLTEAKELKCN